MLGQSQTERFLSLLSNNSRSEFEKQPLRKNSLSNVFTPLSVADLVSKKDINENEENRFASKEENVIEEEVIPDLKLETEKPNRVDNTEEKLHSTKNNTEGLVSAADQREEGSEPEKNTLEEEKNSLQAYDEGYAAGLAAAESSSEGDVIEAISNLNKIIRSTENSDVFNKDYIKKFIMDTIRGETERTIGFCIETLPEKFFENIQNELDKFSYLNEKKTIKLNIEDYELIKSYADFYDGEKFKFVASEKLDRGSILIEVGNIIFNN